MLCIKRQITEMNNLNKYHRGKIYAIRSYQTDDIYIGSSIDRLSNRLSNHRTGFKNYQSGKGTYVTSYEVVKYQDAFIELVEEVKANNKIELNRREGQVIRATPNCVNKYIAGRNKAEYCRDNKEAIAIQKKQYQQDNKEAIAIQRKQYRQDNVDALRIKNEQYRRANKEAIAIQQHQKFNCECGGRYTRMNKAKHSRTRKHQAFINA